MRRSSTTVVLLLLGIFTIGVNSQTPCGIEGYPDNTATLPSQNHNLPLGVIIGIFQLNNVNTSTTVAHPHNEFLQALRYPDGRYELVTTDTFRNFVGLHNESAITRTANLYCNDSPTIVRFVFTIPILRDEEDTTVTAAPTTTTPSVSITTTTMDTTTVPTTTQAPVTTTTESDPGTDPTTLAPPKPCGHVTCPPGDDVNIADPADCGGFVTCAGGVPYCFNCPGNLLYDPVLDQCGFEADVDCGDRPRP